MGSYGQKVSSSWLPKINRVKNKIPGLLSKQAIATVSYNRASLKVGVRDT